MLFSLKKHFNFFYTQYRFTLIAATAFICLPPIIQSLIGLTYLNRQDVEYIDLINYFLFTVIPRLSWLASLVFGHIRQKETIGGQKNSKSTNLAAVEAGGHELLV